MDKPEEQSPDQLGVDLIKLLNIPGSVQSIDISIKAAAFPEVTIKTFIEGGSPEEEAIREEIAKYKLVPKD